MENKAKIKGMLNEEQILRLVSHTTNDPVTRFWSKVEKTSSCWNWTGAVSGIGYGHLEIDGREVKAHRFSMILHRIPIPDGMFVLHKCNNYRCVNPSHLYAGTQAQNMADMANSGHSRQGEKNYFCKLSEKDVCAIRADERTQAAIARDWGLHQSHISYIKRRKVWRHIP